MQGFACILSLSLSLFALSHVIFPSHHGWVWMETQRGKDSLGKKDAHRGCWAPTQTSSLLSSVMAFCPSWRF